MAEPDDRFPVLLERRLILKRPQDDGEADLVIEVGHPYWIEPGIEAACPVAVRGLVGRVNDIRGVDLMGAVHEALRLVETLLKDRKDIQLLWPDGEEFE